MPVSRESSAQTACSAATTSATLLECARQLEASGLSSAARSAYQSAALADESLAGRVELAGFHYRTECYADAAREYESLLQVAAETEDDKLAEVARHNLAVVLRETGQTSRAMTLQARATMQTLRSHGELKTADLTGRALDAVEQDDLDLAENLLLRSLATEKKAGCRSGEANDCANLGAIALLRGDNTVGIRFLARAYHIHLALNDLSNTGKDLLNLAEAFRNVSRWSLASRCLKRAIPYFETCGADQSLRTATERLHEIQQVQNVFARDSLLN